jgi:uncharacterized phiE125 gp8 family phage protein
MWRPVVVTAAPAAEPLTTADAKAQVRVDHSDDDTLIASYVAAARAHVEARTGTRLYTQTVSFKTGDWNDFASLPICPIQSISSVSYTDTAGDVISLSQTVYEARLELLEPSIVLKSGQTWPTVREGSLITVTAVVGYGVANAQPPEVMQAIKLLVADWYDHRATVESSPRVAVPMAAAVDALLANHTKHLI